MTRRSTYQILLGLFALLVVSLQSNALAHAAQYGDGPHEHNGVVCALDGISCPDAVVLPVPLIVPLPMVVQEQVQYFALTPAAFTTPQGRAPPPRSPPLTTF